MLAYGRAILSGDLHTIRYGLCFRNTVVYCDGKRTVNIRNENFHITIFLHTPSSQARDAID